MEQNREGFIVTNISTDWMDGEQGGILLSECQCPTSHVCPVGMSSKKGRMMCVQIQVALGHSTDYRTVAVLLCERRLQTLSLIIKCCLSSQNQTHPGLAQVGFRNNFHYVKAQFTQKRQFSNALFCLFYKYARLQNLTPHS